MHDPYASALLTPDILAMWASSPEDAYTGPEPEITPEAHRAAFPELYGDSGPSHGLLTGPSKLADALVPYVAPRKHQPTSDGRILSRDFGHDVRAQWKLERGADAILHDAGDKLARLDVVNRDTRTPIVAPDRVAWRGKARAKRTCPVQYPEIDPDVTRLADGTTVYRYVTVATGRGVKWLGFIKGHADTRDHGVERAAKRATRVKGAASRGKAVTPAELSPRSLPARWQTATLTEAQTANQIEAVALTSSLGAVVALTGGASLIVDQTCELRYRNERGEASVAGTPRQLARRAALMGHALD